MTSKIADFETTIRKGKVRNRAAQISLAVLMTLIAFIILYPLLFVIATSFKTYGEFIKSPFSVTFAHPENYVKAFTEGDLGTGILNSVIVAAVAVVCQTLITSFAIFGIGVLRFRGAGMFIGILLFTMFISGEMTTIPNLLLIRGFGLYDSLGALIFPAALSVNALGVFLGVNYVKAIPSSIAEAANLDGASMPQLFYYLYLPMMKPVLAFVAISAFSGAWSDFFGPLVYIPMNEKAYTLAITVQKFDTQNNSEYGTLCAGLVILAAPVVLVYSFFSKYFLEGVAVGAIKG